MAPCCRQERKSVTEHGEVFVPSNYYKKDKTFYYVVEQLWSEYMDPDSSLRKSVDALLG